MFECPGVEPLRWERIHAGDPTRSSMSDTDLPADDGGATTALPYEMLGQWLNATSLVANLKNVAGIR